MKIIDLRVNNSALAELDLKIDKKTLKKNIEKLRHTNLSHEFVKQLSKGYLTLECIINSTPAHSQHSVPLDEANALYFKGVLPFYIIQGNFSVEAFYYPQYKLIFLLPGCIDYEVKIKKLLFILENKKKSLETYYNTKTNFGGFYCFHQSPYHYYHFKVTTLLSALEEVSEFSNLIVYSKINKSYFDLSEISKNIESDIVLNNMYPLEVQVEQSTFYFCIGEKNNDLTCKAIKNIDALLSKKIKEKAFDDCKINRIKQLEKTHFILWLGISSGKRTWIEQVVAYRILIEKLVGTVGNVAVIIDGWTRSKSFGPDVPLYSGDEKLSDELASYFINSNVQFIDIVGEYADIKVKVALSVDFFVANHSTGSMWVSRVAGAEGVTHISNAARQSAISQHIHPNSQLIPQVYIADVESEEASTPFHVSYSINPRDFVKFVFPIALKQHNKKKLPLNSDKAFSNLIFSNKTKPADALRDVALAFDEIGDRKTASILMSKALEQRPNGPFIKQKVNDWKPKS